MPESPSISSPAADIERDDRLSEAELARKHRRSQLIKVLIILGLAAAIWFIPAPEGVDGRGMHMLAIFVGTIAGLILQPLPTAAVALIGVSAAMITGAMNADGEALQGFANPTIWLIVSAFFIADGFLITGLGRRIALWFISKVGGSSLGLAYGMAITDLLLAPATPSNTARAGGVLYPIIASLSQVQGSYPESDESRRRLGSYLSISTMNVNAVTSAMFITAMAGNPIAAELAGNQGLDISWGLWAAVAIVPGVLSLIVVPWALYKIWPPTVKKTPQAPQHAAEDLTRMGPLSRGEKVMALTFFILLTLWIAGEGLGIPATTAAFLGVSILLVTKVLTWKDMAANGAAWSTLIFFSVLVGMADQLNTLGIIDWIGDHVTSAVSGLHWIAGFILLTLVYFYLHYLFASNIAHIIAMYAVFLGAAIAIGTPAMFAALFLAYSSNLFGAITHYASGPAGVIFGSGYVKVAEWFRYSFVISVVLILIWGVAGTAWMSLLGVL